MKLDTPRRPRVYLRYLLLEKGGVIIMRGECTQSGGLPHAPVRTGLTHRHSFILLIVINHAILYREPTATTETLASVVVKVHELIGDIVPSRLA